MRYYLHPRMGPRFYIVWRPLHEKRDGIATREWLAILPLSADPGDSGSLDDCLFTVDRDSDARVLHFVTFGSSREGFIIWRRFRYYLVKLVYPARVCLVLLV